MDIVKITENLTVENFETMSVDDLFEMSVDDLFELNDTLEAATKGGYVLIVSANNVWPGWVGVHASVNVALSEHE